MNCIVAISLLTDLSFSPQLHQSIHAKLIVANANRPTETKLSKTILLPHLA